MKPTRYPASTIPLWGLAAALLLALPAAVQAQSTQGRTTQPQYHLAQQSIAAPTATPPAEAAKKDWSIRLGAGALYHPEYEGGDKYKISPAPLVMISYRDVVFLRGPTVGANAFTWQGSRPSDKLQIGPLLRYKFGRSEDDSDDLRGIGDIDGGVELGGFVAYSMGPWSTGLTVFRDLSNNHEGLTAKLSAGHRLPLGPKLLLRSEVSATWADENFTKAFFGITATQSARSGLRQYRPEGGVKDAGITLDLDYSLTANWGITGRLAYKRMLGDAADSPLVEDRGSANQLSTGLFIGYRF